MSCAARACLGAPRLWVWLLVVQCLTGCAIGTAAAPVQPSPKAPSFKVDNPKPIVGRLRGFNLQGMYKQEWGKASGFKEKDFQILQELGFNYARLPLDYKTYTAPGDWFSFVPDKLARIDEAVVWGQKYGIHVSINLHQAPGYCVHDPASLQIPKNQQLNLWKDKAAQRAFIAHWKLFAERYADIPPSHLSFNLINEPGHVGRPVYIRLMRETIRAIREISPNRIIEVDGLQHGIQPVRALQGSNIRLSLHAYEPHGLTHYAAEWIKGSDAWPVPTWPPTMVAKYLYGSQKSELQSPLTIDGDFPPGTQIAVEIAQVSQSAEFQIAADGRVLFEKDFAPGPGSGEWQQSVYDERWKIYQNIYNKSYSAQLTERAQSLALRLNGGDWLTINRILIARGEQQLQIAPGVTSWGVPQATYALNAQGVLTVKQAPSGFEHAYETLGYLEPWLTLKRSGQQVIVGEFGVYKATPHDVTLRFLEDLLKRLKAAGIGWALWDFRGGFGPFDSQRSDVEYQDYRGYQLDREMMALLQKY